MGSSASGKYAVPSVASGVDRELRVKVVHLGSNKQHNILLKVHFVQPAHAGAPATAVDLSSEALSAFFDLEADMALVEVPEDLRQLTEEMRELTLGCKVLSAVPEWLCEFAQLRLLCLTGYSNYGGTGGKEEPIFTQLPGIGSLAKLTTLDLNFLPRLTRMPPCFGQLTALTTLSLTSLYDLEELPVSTGALTSLRELSLRNCPKIKELPTSIECLTALQELTLEDLPNLSQLPACFGRLTTLTELVVVDSGLTDVPSSIEFLTLLRSLRLGMPDESRQDSRAFRALACSLPALRLLQRLGLHGIGMDDRVAVGRSLKAWPLPFLDFDTPYLDIGLQSCWQVLALPPEAADYHDARIVEHWRVQQAKVAAFASGMHVRLGAASHVSSLNDVALVLIADEVLGGWSLLKDWHRECLQREAEPAFWST